MIDWKGKKVPIIYLFLYSEMRKKSGDYLSISYPCVRELLRRRIHEIPRFYHYIILKEMEELGMLKKLGNKKDIRYEFMAGDINKILLRYNPTL